MTILKNVYITILFTLIGLLDHTTIYSKSHTHAMHSKIDACLKKWEE